MRTPGINVAGYLKTESGVGEWARLVIQALEAAGVPHSTLAYERTVLRQEHPFTPKRGWEEHDLTIIGVNADQLPFFVEDVGDVLEGQRRVGLWAWEVEDFPAEMAQSAVHLDAIWALSAHAADAIRPKVAVPVRNVPCPVPLPTAVQRTRSEVGMPEGFVFLFAFDFYSIMGRKNPLGLVEAFGRAFPDAERDGVHLLLKSVNGAALPDQLDRLREAAGRHQNVHVADGYVDASVQHDLLGLCDAYVSLHRAEGFGFTMAEAMSRGKPVIATGYSGNLEFMDDDNSFLVPFAMRPIGPGNDPYPADCPWADPDLDAAVDLLRLVRSGGVKVEETAARAAVDIETRHLPAARATLILEEAARVRGQTPVVDRPALEEDEAQAGPPVPELARQARRVLGAARRPRTTLRTVSKRAIESLDIDRPAPTLPVDSVDADRRWIDLAIRLADAEDRIKDQASEVRRVEARVRSLRDDREDLAAQLDQLWTLVDAVPYTANAEALRVTDAAGRPMLGFDASDSVAARPSYIGFENLFRGSEDFIRERLRPYLPHLRDRAPVLDLGCGRGEMLDLLAAEGIEAFGVDLDAEMVEHGTRKGHRVVHGDAVAELERRDDASLGAVFSAQLIEHLEQSRLLRLLELARSKLRPGGCLIAETVNPHSLRAFKTFWLDPTHVRPIYPEGLLTWVAQASYSRAEVVFPHGTRDLQLDRRWEGEFAIVAWR